MKKIRAAILTLICIFVIASALSWHYKVPSKLWNMLPMPSGAKITVFIHPNSSIRDIAKNFAEAGVIQGSAAEFSRWLARFGIDRKLKPGRYDLVPSSPWNAARQMVAAKPVVESVTIIPGTNIYAFSDIFTESDDVRGITSADVVRALLDDSLYPKDMLNILPLSEDGRISLLMPDTYLMGIASPDELIKLSSGAWWKEFGTKMPTDRESVHNLAIIASLIEREAMWDDERPKIAGVIYNRIKNRMMLQIDAAVVYAHRIKGRKLNRVLHRDLEIDSPYNLYRRTGLPPGPICVPSVLSWKAAIEPEMHELLYYVAGKDGRHLFSKTYNEHLQNTKKVRQK